MNRREAGRIVVGGGLLAGLGWCGLRSDRTVTAAPGSGSPLADFLTIAPEASQIVENPAPFPGPLREAPQLRRLVMQGQLPPVEQRVGPEPIVVSPLHAIGEYGGTLRRGFLGLADAQGIPRFASGPDSLLVWDTQWKRLIPNLAKSFAFEEGDRILTVRLRQGLHWSDGSPFTADDIIFWAEHIHGDRQIVGKASETMMLDGKPIRIERVDALTVRFVCPAPYPILASFLAIYSDLSGPSIQGRAGMGLFAPRHYLLRFHPEFVSEETLSRQARAEGFANWALFLKSKNDWLLNTELPVLTPWRTTKPINQLQHVLERNPYSAWVDTAGNQLPYVDRISHELCATPESINFKAAAGEFDVQDRHLLLNKLPFLLSNRTRTGYRIDIDPYEGCDVAFRMNLDYRADPVIGALLADLRFRKALSLATDREAISVSLMLGTGTPSSTVPARDNVYHPGEQVASLYAGLDPVEANRLLDQIGLRERDSQGYRLRPDGGARVRVPCQVLFAHFDYPAVAELLRDQWREIGIDVDVQILETTLFVQRAGAGEIATTLQLLPCEDPIAYPEFLFPFSMIGSGAVFGPAYVDWFLSGGRRGKRPPPVIVKMTAIWRAAIKAPRADQIEAGKMLIRLHVENLLSIGLVSGGLSFDAIRLSNNDLENVPRRIINSTLLKAPVNAMPITFSYRDEKRREA